MPKSRDLLTKAIFAGTIFLSAFLLFQVQPIISKSILPWFGGSPAVWTSCMLFFQVMLLAGYAYAHFMARRSGQLWAVPLHMVLLAVAFLFLPILPDAIWKPTGDEDPTVRILLLLLATVGLPYVLLASTGPLLQAWYVGWSRGESPYRLYALSNLGSLGALLSYPFVVEVFLKTSQQGWIWSGLFAAFALCCCASGLAYRSAMRQTLLAEKAVGDDEGPAPEKKEDRRTSWITVAIWLLLPALASVMLLAVTNHISQDVAVVPFLWILPLSLYLISFILCFDRSWWYRPTLMSIALIGVTVMVSCIMLEEPLNDWLEDKYTQYQWYEAQEDGTPVEDEWGYDEYWLPLIPEFMDSLKMEIVVYAVALFLICMVCHGEVVRRKPPARELTKFYLTISAGGALGGFLVAVVCPMVFTRYRELQIGMVAATAIASTVLVYQGLLKPGIIRTPLNVGGGFAGLILLPLVIIGTGTDDYSDVVAEGRNFYGALHVEERDEGEYDHRRVIYNGRILHGLQMMADEERFRPTLYYNEESGIGLALQNHPKFGAGMRVGAVGLGSGTLAAYAEIGDHYTFYEINPLVVKLSDDWFTYRSQAPTKIEVELGDARLSLEYAKESQQFDVLALDAFTGDAIPAHLLTFEAFEIYKRHMAEGGIIAVHISNRHLDLKPVVYAAAQKFNYRMLLVDAPDGGAVYDAGSDWLLLTNNNEFLSNLLVVAFGQEVIDPDYAPEPWTDDFSSLWKILE